MTLVFRASFALLSTLLAFAPWVNAAPPERSVSTSRQFLVYGGDLRLRGAICDLAERTKRDLLELIEARDEWTTPIVINAQYPQANLPETPRTALNFSQTGFGLKLQLDLTIASDVTHPEARRELLRAILLEMIYRREPDLAPGATYVAPPDWLLDGVPARDSDLERTEVTEALKMPLSTGRHLSIEKFLRQRPALLDAPGQSLYRAYSFALVDLLRRSPGGRARLARFIADLPSASNDPMADFRSHFPDLLDANGSLEPAWIAHLAQVSYGQSHQLLGAAETGRKLEETLRVKISKAGAETTWRLDEFPKFIVETSAKSALIVLGENLTILATRANPIYRPLIKEYIGVVNQLARGKSKRIPERLAHLQSSREKISSRLRSIDDYLNWFEATKSHAPSGAFADYMRAAEAATRPERTRRDPISVYLDALQTQFQN